MLSKVAMVVKQLHQIMRFGGDIVVAAHFGKLSWSARYVHSWLVKNGQSLKSTSKGLGWQDATRTSILFCSITLLAEIRKS